MPTQSYRRRRKLIEPRIQLRFAAAFACTAGIAVLCQALVVVYLLSSLAREAPNDGAFLLAATPRTLALGLLVSVGLVLPLSLAVGVLLTFPLVGPLYRFRQFLTQALAGEHPGPCRIRKKDELQDFCELLNRATEDLRQRAAPDPRSGGTPEPPAPLPAQEQGAEPAENAARDVGAAPGA